MNEAAAVYITIWITTSYVLLPCWASPLDVHNLTLSRERRQSCRFTCRSGECIGENKFRCDGVKDCADGSDETVEACRDVQCPGFAIRCDYGGCVDGNARCNGVADCVDLSDERFCPGQQITQPCSTGEFKCGSGTCISEVSLCDGRKDCEDGSDETEAACRDFQCPPYAFKCKYGGCVDGTDHCDGVPQCADKSDESPELCASPEPPRNTSRPSVTINENQVCDPIGSRFQAPPPSDCGEKPGAGGVTFILRGNQADYGEFPWHAAVYKTYDRGDNFMNICGGTLVSSRLVISAAHCFWDNSRRKVDQPEPFRIILGKYRANWKTQDADEQRFEVEQLHINCYYKHRDKYYDEDIAAVLLQGQVRITDRVFPICIDWSQKYRLGVKQGVVAGWGLDENYHSPNILRKAWLPYVDINVCRKNIPNKFASYISRRKFCAGEKNGTGVCNGDSGGGFVFKNLESNSWYLWGIVSAGVRNTTAQEDLCSLNDYALFTDLYEFLPWLNLIYI